MCFNLSSHRFRAFARLTMLLLWCGFGVSGCRSFHRHLKVAVIEPTGGLQYWDAFNRQLRQAYPGIDFRFSAPESVNDFPGQARMIGAAVDDGVDGIILSPAHQLVPVSVVSRALKKEIPVVVVGGPLDIEPGKRIAFVGWSNEQIGRMAAERMIQIMHGRGRVGVISSSPTLQGAVTRENAFLERIRLEPNMRSLGVRYALSDWERARRVASDWSSEPDSIQGIFAVDDFCTHGAISAYDKQQANRPVIVGAAEESDQIDALTAGRADAMIVSDPFSLAEQSMQALMNLRANNVVAPPALVNLYAVDGNWTKDSRVPFLERMR